MRDKTVKRLLEPCHSSLTAACPTMNLVATVSKKHAVDVWRFNGQRVFGLPVEEDDSRTVEGLAWRADGKFGDGWHGTVEAMSLANVRY